MKVITSINKTQTYFESLAGKNKYIFDKSKKIRKSIMSQVRDTSNIIELLKELKRDSLQPRHWLQIFNLIKAPHLKNSNTFTVINLREVHIQNF